MKSKYITQGIVFIAIFLIVVSFSFGIFSDPVEDNLNNSENTELPTAIEEANANNNKAKEKELAENSI